ncbi:dTMP kinase [Micrococcales bacterium 31B]|nr:dTMP kinase [Micrococcales bacterium 31B]
MLGSGERCASTAHTRRCSWSDCSVREAEQPGLGYPPRVHCGSQRYGRKPGGGQMSAFIVFEGGDGAGKSTQVGLLAQWLREQNVQVEETRQPGGTRLGASIRDLLLHGDSMTARAEALLYAADRAQHVAEVVRPALDANKVVLCDRYIDSSAAYQGFGRGLGVKEVRKISLWATDRLEPNLTVLLDIDPGVGLERQQGRGLDRLEQESLTFHEGVRQAFLTLAEADPASYLILNADEDARLLHQRIRERAAQLLGFSCVHSEEWTR